MRSTRFIAAETFQPNGKFIAISIRDNGPGMTAASLQKAFNEQFTTKPAGKGTGLGLGIVKRLVTQARGAIHLSSSLQGTKFTVLLPEKA